MSFIYLAVFTDGAVYVGQTTGSFEQLEKRYRSYTQRLTMKRSPVQRLCGKLGMPTLGVLEHVSPEKLDEREKYWIAAHRQEGRTLNVANGGGAQARRVR